MIDYMVSLGPVILTFSALFCMSNAVRAIFGTYIFLDGMLVLAAVFSFACAILFMLKMYGFMQ